MKIIITLLFSLTFVAENVYSQLGPIELMPGNKYLHYLHAFGKPFNDKTRFGWQHIATYVHRYHDKSKPAELPSELMNQAYVTYRVNTWLQGKAGLFYTNVGGYQPSVGLDLTPKVKNLFIIVSPRMDVGKEKSYELFGLFEYTTPNSGSVKFYSRFQFMSNWGDHHNRSYQLFRAGVLYREAIFGLGFNLDEYGKQGKAYKNFGVFVRHTL